MPAYSKVGADPKTIPYFQWSEYDTHLRENNIHLIRVKPNLVDEVWKNNRPAPPHEDITEHPLEFAGETWENKIKKLRESTKYKPIIITSLTEIAYLLNLRSKDLPHTPVFKVNLRTEKKHSDLESDL